MRRATRTPATRQERQLPDRYTETIFALVHGEPDAGKSWLGQTTPAPRLVLDAEGGSRHVRKIVNGRAERVPMVRWDPMRDAPPVDDGTWEMCEVYVRDFNVIKRVYQYLNEGAHPFRSVVLDSLTEIQKRCKDAISGEGTPSERQWGELLIQMEQMIRLQFRDLTFHPTHPIECIVVLALTQERGRNSKSRPAVQGALGTSLPGYVDLEGYLASSLGDDGIPERRMLIHNHELYEAKCRLHDLTEHYGSVIANPNFTDMLDILNTEAANK